MLLLVGNALETVEKLMLAKRASLLKPAPEQQAAHLDKGGPPNGRTREPYRPPNGRTREPYRPPTQRRLKGRLYVRPWTTARSPETVVLRMLAILAARPPTTQSCCVNYV